MPVWLQVLVGVFAVITAIGVAWTKMVRPAARLVTLAEEVVPLLRELTEQAPNTLKVLNDMAQQFRTDSGSSLRDVVNRLDEAAKEAQVVSSTLAINVETQARRSGSQDVQLERLVQLLSKLVVQVEQSAVADAVVASDLTASQQRADAVEGEAGEAADAGVRSDPTKEAQ